MQRLNLPLNGKDAKIFFQRMGSQVWLHFGGRTLCVDIVSKRERGDAAEQANAGHIVAPMPGKILKVPVQAGQKVAAGTTVVVMEAMKMEYSLAASVESTVKTVNCKEGQQVALSQVLVELEPA